MNKFNKGDKVIHTPDNKIYIFNHKVGLDWAQVEDEVTGTLDLVSVHKIKPWSPMPWEMDFDWIEELLNDFPPAVPQNSKFCMCTNPDPKKSTMLFGEVFFVCECCKKELKP